MEIKELNFYYFYEYFWAHTAVPQAAAFLFLWQFAWKIGIINENGSSCAFQWHALLHLMMMICGAN